MIDVIVFSFCVSTSIFFLSTIHMLECLRSKDKHVIVLNFEKRTRTVFECVYVGTAMKLRGKVHQFGHNTLFHNIHISLTGVRHFVAPRGGVIGTGDIVYVDGTLEYNNGELFLTDVNFIALKDKKLINNYLDKLWSKLFLICLGVFSCLEYRLEVIQLFTRVMDFLSKIKAS